MTSEPVTFRRAGVDRRSKEVFVEVRPNEFYTLPGDYDPAKLLAQVIARRFVFLDRWVKL